MVSRTTTGILRSSEARLMASLCEHVRSVSGTRSAELACEAEGGYEVLLEDACCSLRCRRPSPRFPSDTAFPSMTVTNALPPPSSVPCPLSAAMDSSSPVRYRSAALCGSVSFHIRLPRRVCRPTTSASPKISAGRNNLKGMSLVRETCSP
jgi:hypothetical protein